MAGVAAAAFVSTSLDNLFLLMGVVAGSRARRRDVVLGYVAAVTAVLLAALAGSWILDYAADRWLRFLGLVPLGMGLFRLRALARDTDTSEPLPTAPGTGFSSVFWIMLANSGDSFGVFASLMGETRDGLLPVIFGTALVLASLWATFARWVVQHPALAPRLRFLDTWGVPLVLVALGLYILLDSSTDTV